MPPNIVSISPNIGAVNKTVTISGSDFGLSISESKVVFSRGVREFIVPDADIISWSNTEIECYTPEIPEIGNWKVTVRVVSNA